MKAVLGSMGGMEVLGEGFEGVVLLRLEVFFELLLLGGAIVRGVTRDEPW